MSKKFSPAEKKNILPISVFIAIVAVVLIHTYTSAAVKEGGNNTNTTNMSCTCTDSDGLNWDIKGNTTGEMSPGGTTVSYTDFCFNTISGSNGLAEYYCTENKCVARKDYTCLNVCKDGACIDNCKAADATKEYPDGKNIYKVGECKSSSIYAAGEVCSGSRNIEEWYCKEGGCRTEEITCPSGTECKDGACIKNTTSGTISTIKRWYGYKGGCSAVCPAYKLGTCIYTLNPNGTKGSCGQYGTSGKVYTCYCQKN